MHWLLQSLCCESHPHMPLVMSQTSELDASQSLFEQHADDGMHPAPQRLYPLEHVKSHALPSQVAMPLLGTLHGVHCAPQAVTLVSATQLLEQLCVPCAHTLLQGAF
jgi:hypothetical protein